MKILMISPELAPYAKAGGLGDMVASLSKALAQMGHEVRICIPRYGSVNHDKTWTRYPNSVAVHLDPRRTEFCSVWSAPFAGGATVYFIEYDVFFGSDQIYGERTDHGHRFGFQTLAALDFCLQDGWTPDIVHAHDWTAGLASVILNTTRRHTPVGKAASVFTVHNLQHQGLVNADVLNYLALPSWLLTPNNLECFGGVNLLKGALYHSTKITTVSPTYAHEIQTPQYGFGLDPVLLHRWNDLSGIVNGIDTDEWNPASDKYIPAHYTADDLSGKAQCKTALQQALGLEQDYGAPIFGIVARLYDQKGLDLLSDILPDLLSRARMQIALLGSGERWLEEHFLWLANKFPGKCGVRIGYDNALAHLIEAGSDFFLMPSSFEPCGLNQMYSMRYGTLPIVRATGGLADTVRPWITNPAKGTGILFADATSSALMDAIHRGLQLYFNYSGDFSQLRRNAMACDFSWGTSAKAYEAVYQDAIYTRKGAFFGR
ncbi:MAG: glycogen synthase GlgA [Puniceicoccales bacterium]|jgi:starch synthase|nr:glycogen synthase GlgA [Puniceicoccales bacterium]